MSARGCDADSRRQWRAHVGGVGLRLHGQEEILVGHLLGAPLPPVGGGHPQRLLDALSLEQRTFIEAHTGVTAETCRVTVVLGIWSIPWCAGRASDGKAYGCSGHAATGTTTCIVSSDSTAKRVEDVGPSDAPRVAPVPQGDERGVCHR